MWLFGPHPPRQFMQTLACCALLWTASQSVADERAPCASHDPLRQPWFGDLHVHTAYSFDAYVSSIRRDPWDAYRYAKGESIQIPGADGVSTQSVSIDRPLDFAAVTDHAEFLGQINVCTEDPSRAGYWWPHCIMTRGDGIWTQLLAADWWIGLSGQKAEHPELSAACELSDCEAAGDRVWANIQRAAEQHYDRSASCEFTTFVGYEYTDAPEANNMHRNVIFRNEQVTPRPISTYETGRYQFARLWRMLDEQCIDSGTGCDVMAIPHNPNLSGGLMFRDPLTPQEAKDRLAFEPVVELVQHKGASECRYDRLLGRGLETEDELCDFEQVPADNLQMLGTVNGTVHTERAKEVPLDRFGARNMVRNALKAGLALEQESGVNPFKMGFIGSTDTHTATPGAASEQDFAGHLGRRDAGYRTVQDHFFSNPGGLAVVWAEENSRDALFDAIKRRETYATSGTRPVLRFFAARELPADSCDRPDANAIAYQQGVPMGGELNTPVQRSPDFLISAIRDPGTPIQPGNTLQRIQVIKGWVDADGETHEQVFDVAGNADNGASVDPQTCTPTGPGADQLCRVWQDPDFNPTQAAFYYARVLENPSCRWSTLQCKAAGVDPFSDQCDRQAESANAHAAEVLGASGDVYGKCCLDAATRPFYSPVIQERAWSSPIWYSPEAIQATNVDQPPD